MKRLLLVIGAIMLLACGCNGGGSSTDTAAATVKEGQFLDSAVSGLHYQTPTRSGYTDENGFFRYEQGERVQFLVGNVSLGEAAGKPLLTPLDLVPGAKDESDPVVTNICRFLHGLDEDGDPENGITIPESAQTEAIEGSVNFNQSIRAFEKDPVVGQTLARVKAPEKAAMPTAPKVQDHMEATLGSVTMFDNGFKISLIGVAYGADGTSEWRYFVEETETSKDLSYWVLGLPECTAVVEASPAGYELVDPDPNTGISGIKWETDEDFEAGEFMVLLDGPYDKGAVQVSVKSKTSAIGAITGPACALVTSDADGDGYTIADGDCDDSNPDVNPGAEEICGDGIDQDCDGSDLACPGESTEKVTFSNGFEITYAGVTYNEDGSSTWMYRVEETAASKDLSNWVLELPGCVSVTGASPGGYELVHPDPNANLNGIKWEVADDFESGDFSVTLDAHWNEGIVLVAAKGPRVALGELAGPECTIMNEDFDKDGYTVEQGDCNDKNPDIYPGAPEICGDGIDQDCNGQDLPCSSGQETVALSNGFEITFVSVASNTDGTSSWVYKVSETESSKDLSYWVLGLPACTAVVDASPAGYELVDPDPNTGISGIKWETDESFEAGEFMVILDDEYVLDMVQAAAKARTSAAAAITGPGCDNDEDKDGDGFTPGQGDCNDEDNMIYPGAIEICGDGIDQDCDGVDQPCTDVPGEAINCENLFIPPGHLPPPGECRVWEPGLPPGLQGPPVSCDCSLAAPGTCLIDSNGDVVDCN
jgi:hypothetical protein